MASAFHDHLTPMPIGAMLGSYRVVQLLGEGGMGFVYLGEHARIGRRVAIKVLRPDLALRPDVVERFFGEAKSVNQIRHAHIIDVYDFVELDRTHVFIVMELLMGRDLKNLLDREGPLHPVRAAGVAVQISDALMAVHERGIVHRDLKPENIFLIDRGGMKDFVKLLDFGIAKLARDSGEVGHTQTGAVFGTPQYMSPEQARGLPVDGRSDLYSVGMILYTLITGAPAFEGVGFGDIMMKQISDPPPPMRGRMKDASLLSAALEKIIMRALKKDRDDRFQSMAEMRNILVNSVPGLRLPPTIDITALRSYPTGDLPKVPDGDSVTREVTPPVVSSPRFEGVSAPRGSRTRMMVLGGIAIAAAIGAGAAVMNTSSDKPAVGPEPTQRAHEAAPRAASPPILTPYPNPVVDKEPPPASPLKRPGSSGKKKKKVSKSIEGTTTLDPFK